MATAFKSFTVRDIITVQVMLGLLLLIYFASINPSKKLSEIKNEIKSRDVYTIVNAINAYKKDHGGSLPQNLPAPGNKIEIAKNADKAADICSELVPKYIPELPVNPDLSLVPVTDCSTDYKTGYYITLSAGGKIIGEAK